MGRGVCVCGGGIGEGCVCGGGIGEGVCVWRGNGGGVCVWRGQQSSSLLFGEGYPPTDGCQG